MTKKDIDSLFPDPEDIKRAFSALSIAASGAQASFAEITAAFSGLSLSFRLENTRRMLEEAMPTAPQVARKRL